MYMYYVAWHDSKTFNGWLPETDATATLCKTLGFSSRQLDITLVNSIVLLPTVSDTGYVLDQLVIPTRSIERIVEITEEMLGVDNGNSD